jgi:hypothetical protein
VLRRISVVAVLYVLLCAGADPNGHRPDRGIVVCSGPGDMFIETITMIEQTRYKTNTTLPIAVAHCNELTPPLIEILKTIPDVAVLNICEIEPKLLAIQSRIKGFFCKPAAILASPFAETMVVDSDVVWFDNPDKLFESDAFKTTGTLFFRDRWTRTKNKLTLTRGTQNPSHIESYMNSMLQYVHTGADYFGMQHLKPAHHHHHHSKANQSLGHNLGTIDLKTLAKSNSYWRDHAMGNRGASLDHWQVHSICFV